MPCFEMCCHLDRSVFMCVCLEALAKEPRSQGVPFQQQVELPTHYECGLFHAKCRIDFLCFGAIVVEIKAQARLGIAEEALVINYLKASGHEIGLFLNFGATSLECKRFAFSKSTKSA